MRWVMGVCCAVLGWSDRMCDGLDGLRFEARARHAALPPQRRVARGGGRAGCTVPRAWRRPCRVYCASRVAEAVGPAASWPHARHARHPQVPQDPALEHGGNRLGAGARLLLLLLLLLEHVVWRSRRSCLHAVKPAAPDEMAWVSGLG